MLRVSRDERVAFKRDLKRLAASGDLMLVRGNRYALPDAEDLVPGRLHTNPSGFGFVTPDDAEPGERRDIYIASANLTRLRSLPPSNTDCAALAPTVHSPAGPLNRLASAAL